MKVLVVTIFLFVSSLSAQNNYTLNVGRIKQKKYHNSFPFENVKGKIIIDVTINNKIRKFILDTGAPTSISDKIASEINYRTITYRTKGTDANGKDGELDIIQIPKFSINGLIFLNSYALKLLDMSFLECFNAEGIIGSNSLRNSVVDFDFKTKKVTISSDFASFRYPIMNSDDVILEDFQSTPILKVKMKLGYLTLNQEVIFDTGDDSFYSISTNNLNQLLKNIKENQLPTELQNINQSDLLGIVASSNGSFSTSLFGSEVENTHYKFKIQDFIFGSTSFGNVIATTTHGVNSRVGSEILNYGKLTLDYKNKKYYFQEYGNKKEVDVNHKFKSIYPAFENNKLVVGIIWDEKLKEKIKVGDEILKVNDVEFNKLTRCEVMLMSFDDFKGFDKLNMTVKDIETNEIKVVDIRN